MTNHLTRLPAGPAHLRIMLPPPVPIQGPNIDIPSVLAHSQYPASHSVPPGLALMQSQQPASLSLPSNLGYGVQHLQYAAQHNHWAHVAHRLPPAEAISLEISVYENGSKRKNAHGTALGVSIFFIYLCFSPTEPDVIFKSICEGLKDIPVVATTAELAVMALEMIAPCIKAYDPRFAWHEHEFIVRDAK